MKRWVLALAAASQLSVGAAMALAPAAVYDRFATFPPENTHFVRDLSTIYVALGVVLAIAVRRPSWRLPVLAFAAVQYATHAVNHAIDIADPHREWVGPPNLGAVTGGLDTFAVLAWALRHDGRSQAERRSTSP